MENSKSSYIEVISQRREQALAFEMAAIRKYGTLNHWYWGTDGPIPYGRHYELEFAHVVMRYIPSDVIPYLDKTFIGDEADQVYLEGLLVDMEFMGYFNNNVVVVWQDSITAWRCELSDQDKLDLITHGVEHSKLPFARKHKTRFDGNSLQKAKADVIRRWIASKATERSISLPTKKVSTKKSEVAYLDKIDLENAKKVLSLAGLGNTSKAGEWSAAIIALREKKCLVAKNAYKAHDWFISIGLSGTTRRTISSQWEQTEAREFKNIDERKVFRSVCLEVDALLSNSNAKP